MTWRNWVGDQTCAPAEIVHPRNLEELRAAIGRAHKRGWTVRAVGSGHSFSEAVLNDGMLISLDGMQKILDVDAASGLVRIEAGISLHALNDALALHGLALPNLGDIDVQSVAGAMATGTHGTGRRHRTLSAQIESLQLVCADGSVVEIDEDSDADAWRAARVSIGALGVISQLTLRVIPSFTLIGVDTTASFDETVDAFDELVNNNEHFEFYVFAHSDRVLTRTNNRVEADPRVRSSVRAWAEDELLVNYLFGMVCRIGRRFPSAVPVINRLSTRLAGTTERIDSSHRIFASTRRVKFTESEYAIPRERAPDAIRAVREVAARREFKPVFPIEVRAVAPDDAFLSPAFGRDTCFIAAHSFRGTDWRPYFAAFEELMDSFEGRPHWGKRHSQTAETLRPRYPEWDSFARVRRRLDPEGRFANAYVRRVLGDVGKTEVAPPGDRSRGPASGPG